MRQPQFISSKADQNAKNAQVAAFRAETKKIKDDINAASVKPEGWYATDHSEADQDFFAQQERGQQSRTQKAIDALESRDATIDQLAAQIAQFQQQAPANESNAELARHKVAIECLQKIIVDQSIENNKQKRVIEKQESTISEKEKDNASHAQLQRTYRETDKQLAKTQVTLQVVAGENKRLQQSMNELAHKQGTFHNRMISALALFESSKTTGWEQAFIQMLKAEFKEQ